MPAAAAQGHHPDGHAAADQVPAAVGEPGQVHAAAQRRNGGRAQEPGAGARHPQPGQPGRPRGRQLQPARRHSAQARQVRLRQDGPPHRQRTQSIPLVLLLNIPSQIGEKHLY